MEKLVLIDGNSIMNRAFYGIMGSKMLTAKDGKYTNAIYGFLSIMFKIIEDLKPEYMAVAFDLKGPTERHELYEGYKANRKGMPNELAEQMPIIKEVLRAMNIDVIEKQGFEGDDIIGTMAKYGEAQGLSVTILSGDRDNFQLASDNVTIRIPRTKMGKTEVEDFDRKKVQEIYGLEPKQLIEVKALQGDTSDNIPGVPGIGEKTALSLIQKYQTIDNLYKQIEEGTDDLKGKQKENITTNKELAYLSRKLGEINTNVPLEDNLETLRVEEWDKEKVLTIFKKLNFKKYIEKFDLNSESTQNLEKENNSKNIFEIVDGNEKSLLEEIKKVQELVYYFELEEDFEPSRIVKKKIKAISIYINGNIQYVDKPTKEFLKEIFENEQIKKYGHDLTEDYIILKQEGITMKSLKYDSMVAAYILNPTKGKYLIEDVINEYLGLELEEYLKENNISQENSGQITLFQNEQESNDKGKYKIAFYAHGIQQLRKIMLQKLEEIDALKLFEEIDMPTVEVLSDMQWNGMYVSLKELEEYGNEIKGKIENLTKEIYGFSGEEFNTNTTKQLGEILFEKLKLPVVKKNKSGYSTDVDVLEKLREEHPIIEKILEYRQVMKKV